MPHALISGYLAKNESNGPRCCSILSSDQVPLIQDVLDYLVWHHFGDDLSERSCDLVNMYKKYFMTKIHPDNLAKLVEQFNWRPMVNMKRDENVLQLGDSHTLKVPAFNKSGQKLVR